MKSEVPEVVFALANLFASGFSASTVVTDLSHGEWAWVLPFSVLAAINLWIGVVLVSRNLDRTP